MNRAGTLTGYPDPPAHQAFTPFPANTPRNVHTNPNPNPNVGGHDLGRRILPERQPEAEEIGAFLMPAVILGRRAIAVTRYLGGLKLLGLSAVRAVWAPPASVQASANAGAGAVSFRAACYEQLAWIMAMGLPLAALVHLALGGFLAMQAYYGATFVLAAGPVVLIGMFRDVGPLMTGFLLAGLMGTRVTSDFRRHGFEVAPSWLTAVRIVAAMIAGPVLALTSAFVGTAIGAIMSLNHLGVPVTVFLENGWRMVWLRDIVGLAVKSALFGAVTALFACYEGFRLSADARPVHWSCYRACLFGVLSVLFVNTSWFVLVYIAGPAFGPTVLTPPVP